MQRALTALLLLIALQPALAGDRVVFVYGEDEYGSHETMPALAAELERRLGLECVLAPSEDGRLPDLSVLDGADQLVLFLRFRDAEEHELQRLAAWFEAGKPAVALRTTSHAFLEPKGWFPPFFGGHYKGHADNEAGTVVVASVPSAEHPLLRGVPRSMDMGHGGTYNAQPLSEGAEVLLFGRTADLPSEPVAWTFEYKPGSRIFYTSLGSAQNFEREGFRELLANAVLWGMEREVPAGGAFGGAAHPPCEEARWSAPPAPLCTAPEDSTVLLDARGLVDGPVLGAWRHWDPSVAPRAMHIDERADTSSGGPVFEGARWKIDSGSAVARPGFGDVVTVEEFGDCHLHLDFCIPPQPPWVPDELRGASGVFLAGRYEIALLDSWQKDTDEQALGGMPGTSAPRLNAAREPGSWQSLDVTYSQRAGQPPTISAWIDDRLVLDGVTPEEASVGGFLEPLPGVAGDAQALFTEDEERSRECDWGLESFAVSAIFRAHGDGSIVSKCPPAGRWVPDAKVLFLRGGHLVYDIGWVGAIESKERYDDEKWHHVVLTSDDGHARLYVDGEQVGQRRDFDAPDEAGFRMKIGAANEDFGGTFEGDVGEVEFYATHLSRAAARELSADEDDFDQEPVWTWENEGVERVYLDPGEPLGGPIRLQADCSPVRFANIWVAPLGEVDHAAVLASLDEGAYHRGEEIYSGLCTACHGPDGTRPTNPKARPFATGELQNGKDPLSLFKTVTAGYKEMPANAWLTPRQRYDVIHYVRERFLKDKNPSQYFEVTDPYLSALPKGRSAHELSLEGELAPRDYGPGLASSLGNEVGTALTIHLDDQTTISYDLQVMTSPGAWTGGFLELSSTQHYQQRGEGLPVPGGEMLEGLQGLGWGHGGTTNWDRDRRPHQGPLPKDWLDYHGRYVHGERIVLAYAIDGREVLELPGVDRTSGMPVITHHLRIGPGEQPLVLSLGGVSEAGAPLIEESSTGVSATGLPWTACVVGSSEEDAPRVALAVLGTSVPMQLDGWSGRAEVRFAGAPQPGEYLVLRHSAHSEEELAGFAVFLENVLERPLPPGPEAYMGGGSARWAQEFTTRGELGEGGAYVVDTLTLPPSNPWNVWIRTSALDFFEDGRCAVSTYGGDVWVVSGIDDDLHQLTWRRIAGGMFEPMGLRVIDGVIYVTCRDRIVRLHDLNGDGETDFYESFFPDPDVTATFHAFNFDLQTDPEGYLYYAKSGQYTRYALPGAILKIAPDGKSHEVYCTGLRTPNGMGMSPDGRPLVSDNQGNWVPASKVSLTRPGGFYGVFKSINMNGAGKQDRDTFDQPVIWMPQRIDSSSGGQLWVDDERFGPLSGRYLHTSFGKGWIYPLVVSAVDGVEQGAIWRLPFQFDAGLQRLRQSPADGQVYTVGLSGWQGPGGGKDGCLQRLRYTGAPEAVLVSARATSKGVALEFDRPLAAVADLSGLEVRRWNYRWARSYGSAHYSLDRPGEEGQDEVPVRAARLGSQDRVLEVELESMVPCHQLSLRYHLRSAGGADLSGEVLLTVNAVP